MTLDWSKNPTGVPYADYGNPQSLNLYSYVDDNPVSAIDPNGHLQAGFGTGCGSQASLANCLTLGQDSHLDAAMNSTTQRVQDSMLSASGLKFIEKWEGGFYSHVYDASGKKHLGDWTIGWGHSVTNRNAFPNGITLAQGEKLLENDVKTAAGAVNGGIKRFLFQNQFDALVDFTFNEGGHALYISTLRSVINGGGNVSMYDFTVWDKSGISRAFNPGLLNRRKAEYVLYATGNYGD